MGYGRRQQIQNDRRGRRSRSSDVLKIGAGIKTRKVYRSGVARDFNCCELRQRILPHSSSQEVSFRRSFFVQFHLLVFKSSALMTCQNSGESLFHGWGLGRRVPVSSLGPAFWRTDRPTSSKLYEECGGEADVARHCRIH